MIQPVRPIALLIELKTIDIVSFGGNGMSPCNIYNCCRYIPMPCGSPFTIRNRYLSLDKIEGLMKSVPQSGESWIEESQEQEKDRKNVDRMSLTRIAQGKYFSANLRLRKWSALRSEEKPGRQKPSFSLSRFTLAPLPKRFPFKPRTSFRLDPFPLVVSPFVSHGDVVGSFFLLRGH